MIRALTLLIAVALAVPALAVQPDEILDDPALESRARDISAGLRCLVCRNESIDESNADLARDMRLLVRERLVEGDSDSEVLAFVVERYGEYILLRPTTDGINIVLWIAAPVLFLIALGSSLLYLRSRATAQEPTNSGLSPEEEARLKELLKD
ncbi:MAG: cytochrome c-type biogenesis protein CcmH [Rhodobacteraceae bacterium]|nr:MAG: cytochrome c-type biogenesis protein CcmH [Paracoccaceae bacterium]